MNGSDVHDSRVFPYPWPLGDSVAMTETSDTGNAGHHMVVPSDAAQRDAGAVARLLVCMHDGYNMSAVLDGNWSCEAAE